MGLPTVAIGAIIGAGAMAVGVAGGYAAGKAQGRKKGKPSIPDSEVPFLNGLAAEAGYLDALEIEWKHEGDHQYLHNEPTVTKADIQACTNQIESAKEGTQLFTSRVNRFIIEMMVRLRDNHHTGIFSAGNESDTHTLIVKHACAMVREFHNDIVQNLSKLTEEQVLAKFTKIDAYLAKIEEQNKPRKYKLDTSLNYIRGLRRSLSRNMLPLIQATREEMARDWNDCERALGDSCTEVTGFWRRHLAPLMPVSESARREATENFIHNHPSVADGMATVYYTNRSGKKHTHKTVNRDWPYYSMYVGLYPGQERLLPRDVMVIGKPMPILRADGSVEAEAEPELLAHKEYREYVGQIYECYYLVDSLNQLYPLLAGGKLEFLETATVNKFKAYFQLVSGKVAAANKLFSALHVRGFGDEDPNSSYRTDFLTQAQTALGGLSKVCGNFEKLLKELHDDKSQRLKTMFSEILSDQLLYEKSKQEGKVVSELGESDRVTLNTRTMRAYKEAVHLTVGADNAAVWKRVRFFELVAQEEQLSEARTELTDEALEAEYRAEFPLDAGESEATEGVAHDTEKELQHAHTPTQPMPAPPRRVETRETEGVAHSEDDRRSGGFGDVEVVLSRSLPEHEGTHAEGTTPPPRDGSGSKGGMTWLGSAADKFRSGSAAAVRALASTRSSRGTGVHVTETPAEVYARIVRDGWVARTPSTITADVDILAGTISTKIGLMAASLSEATDGAVSPEERQRHIVEYAVYASRTLALFLRHTQKDKQATAIDRDLSSPVVAVMSQISDLVIEKLNTLYRENSEALNLTISRACEKACRIASLDGDLASDCPGGPGTEDKGLVETLNATAMGMPALVDGVADIDGDLEEAKRSVETFHRGWSRLAPGYKPKWESAAPLQVVQEGMGLAGNVTSPAPSPAAEQQSSPPESSVTGPNDPGTGIQGQGPAGAVISRAGEPAEMNSGGTGLLVLNIEPLVDEDQPLAFTPEHFPLLTQKYLREVNTHYGVGADALLVELRKDRAGFLAHLEGKYGGETAKGASHGQIVKLRAQAAMEMDLWYRVKGRTWNEAYNFYESVGSSKSIERLNQCGNAKFVTAVRDMGVGGWLAATICGVVPALFCLGVLAFGTLARHCSKQSVSEETTTTTNARLWRSAQLAGLDTADKTTFAGLKEALGEAEGEKLQTAVTNSTGLRASYDKSRGIADMFTSGNQKSVETSAGATTITHQASLAQQAERLGYKFLARAGKASA